MIREQPVAPEIPRSQDDSKTADQDSPLYLSSLRHLPISTGSTLGCRIDDEQGAGDHQPAVRVARWDFLFGYFLFETPGNLLLHKIGARSWIAHILVTWGNRGHVDWLCPQRASALLVRFLLGLAEAGHYPGVVLYLTYWFRQREGHRL